MHLRTHAQDGDMYLVHHCLGDGADPNGADRFGQTALHAAAAGGRKQVRCMLHALDGIK